MPITPAPKVVGQKPKARKRPRGRIEPAPNAPDIWDMSHAEFTAKYGESRQVGEPLPVLDRNAGGGSRVGDAGLAELLDDLLRAEELAKLQAAESGPAPAPSLPIPVQSGVRDRLTRDAARMVEDLLRDLPDAHRPVAQEIAEQSARSLLWNSSLNIVLEESLAAPDGVSLGKLAAVTKVQRRLAESFRHNLIVLELLRHRYADVRATVVPITRAKKVANGRRR